ncbi:class F sortase [Frankia sp. AiPa1]|uniref:class F sortase n=1 Tax=Frankia sp. AiPa1 TaxID=573492 RepID=UPI00202AD53B|nr:class F sortase [Frankia sp. AiPa1]MCL9757902.1 class F sortase [Frankia sp. AiPa1]
MSAAASTGASAEAKAGASTGAKAGVSAGTGAVVRQATATRARTVPTKTTGPNALDTNAFDPKAIGANARAVAAGIVGPAAHRFGGVQVYRRRLSAWHGLLLIGLVLVLASGFRLAEPAFDALRGDSRTDAANELPPIPAPPPPVPFAPAVAPSAAARPAVTINDPTRLQIPRLSVNAPIVHLGQNRDGTIAVPTAWGDVGWFDRGPAPGGIGPSVLVGHYDSTTGPAAFYRLNLLVPGDRVVVVGASGASQAFVVDRSEEVTKATFPAQRVYGPVTRPELRLITCGGAFDFHTHHYLSNLVVYAHADTGPAALPPPAPPAPPAGTAGTAGVSIAGGPAAASSGPSSVPPSQPRAEDPLRP